LVQPDKTGKAELEQVDRVMRQGVKRVFPAAVLLVKQRGKVLIHRAYGWLEPESKRQPTQPDSLFDLASLSKLFTATAFMTLAEAGRVGLDTAVSQILPQFSGLRPIAPTIQPQTKALLPPDPQFAGQEVDAAIVTFRHLLTHTSGLPAWRDFCPGNGAPDVLPWQIPADVRAKRLAALYENFTFAYPPGQQIVYSDVGFILLGEAVARLSGVPLDAYLKQAMLDPLALKDTVYNPLAHGVSPERIVPTEFCRWRQRRCWGEVHDENAACLGGAAGHAGLFATAEEAAVLGWLYANDGHSGRIRLLPPSLTREATREQAAWDGERRGLGWLLSSSGSPVGSGMGANSYGHTGFTGTSLWVDPERELVVVLLTNRVYYGRDPHGIKNFRARLHDAVTAALKS
jgi:CubicO group peptidase (beta-lactamase class C family)